MFPDGKKPLHVPEPILIYHKWGFCGIRMRSILQVPKLLFLYNEFKKYTFKITAILWLMCDAFYSSVGEYKLIRGFGGMYDGWEQYGGVAYTHSLDYVNNGAKRRRSMPQGRGYYVDYAAIDQYIMDNANTYQLFNLRGKSETEKVIKLTDVSSLDVLKFVS